MTRRQDPHSRSHTDWVADITQAKTSVRQWVRAAEEEGTPSNAILVDETMTPEQVQAFRGLHGAVLDYHSQLKPYEERIAAGEANDLWTDVVYEVSFPDHLEACDTPPAEISMETAGDWRMTNITLEHTVIDRYGGEQTETESHRVFLPPAASAALYDQLNSALKDLGLAAEVKEMEAEIIPAQPGGPDA